MAGQLNRGDLVVVSAADDYGKLRPAIIIQSDLLNNSDSVLVALLTSTLADTPVSTNIRSIAQRVRCKNARSTVMSSSFLADRTDFFYWFR